MDKGDYTKMRVKLEKRLKLFLVFVGCMATTLFWLNLIERKKYKNPSVERQQHYQGKNITEHDGTRIRHCTQKERLDHMRHYCNISYLATVKERMKPEGRSLINDDQRYLLCWMSKAGCTALKYVILETRGFNQEKQTNRSNINEAHYENTIKTYGFRYLKSVDKNDRWNIVNNYFNMLAIRHPFDRIVSYYRDKIVDTDRGSAHPGRAAEILRYTRPEIFARNSTFSELKHPQTVLGPPTFEEFMKWLYENRVVDEHWNFIIDACHPCAHHWNVILKMETIAVDGKLLLEKIGSNKTSIPIRHTHRNDIDMNYFEKQIPEYRSISGDIIEYLMKSYSTDMEMFGYGWDKQTNTAYCRIRTPSGFCC
ncbi:hypothetical protein LSH36_76g01011 [Paralvinella palmiformis]|uniref:Carbohydrate sulfotransferase n=1 Tax=Paralvinella palmiformis TaxID=53620 RepID=A0AAD9K3X7_9ANNE|nr:hypothetical protein LSH36_76g01011 [Paralvinella palmiformis]